LEADQAAAFGAVITRFLEDPEAPLKLSVVERDHPYWEKFQRRVKPLGYQAEHLWRLVKQQRRFTARRIWISSERDFQFSYNLTDEMQQTLHRLDMHMGGTLGGATTIPEGTREQVLTSSLMEEAISSSLLEGAATTREVAKNMLRTDRKPRDRSERMVLNNYLTMQQLVQWKQDPMTVERLLEIHRMVSNGTLEDAVNEGRVRTNNDVHVVNAYGEVLYDPPTHERLPAVLEAFCRFANDEANNPFIHPVVRGITLHFLIGYIHPFVDGNGRTARALFYWYLLRKGYWLVEYLAISKIILRAPSQYGRAYLHTEHDDNDLTYFLDFNLRSLRLAMDDLDHYLGRKLAERKGLFAVIRNVDINERQAEIVALWLREPERTLTIQEVVSRSGVVYQTGRTDLLGLVALGLATHRKAGNKMLFFRSVDFEAQLTRLKRA
jgi:Fic family protein